METFTYSTPSGLEFRHSSDNKGDFLFVNSNNLFELLEYVKKNRSVKLELNSQRGFTMHDLSFLTGYEHHIDSLAIVEESLNLNGIEKFINLRYLQIFDKLSQPIEFEKLIHLSYCAILWNKNYQHTIFPSGINFLSIWQYKQSIGFNTKSLFNLKNVRNIKLVQASILNLSIIEYCKHLVRLEIVNSRTLVDIKSLLNHSATLTYLDIDKCKKIEDFTVLTQLTELRSLNLCDCKTIPNLSFLKNLPNLEHFAFFGTIVEDGDLSYLKNIKHVAFDNRAHYSLKMKDFGITEES